MKHSLQRQRRLLAVRSLQADFAAAEVRRSQMAGDEVRTAIQEARRVARPDTCSVLSPSCDPKEWLLTCAEQEIAGMKIDYSMNTLQEIEVQTESLRMQESVARQERDQIKKVCERLKRVLNYEEQIKEQALLDDIFSASFLVRQNLRT